jgi:hypothetical protein
MLVAAGAEIFAFGSVSKNCNLRMANGRPFPSAVNVKK